MAQVGTYSAIPDINTGQWLWRRLVFSRRVRADVWQLLADVMQGGGHLSQMLETLAEAYSLRGQHTIAAILLELRAAVPEARFTERLVPYVGTAERLLWQGYETQDVATICRGCARVLRMEMALTRAIWGAVAQPLLLLVGFFGLMLLFGLSLFPAFAEVVDFTTLPRGHQIIIAVTTGFAARPWLLLAGLGTILMATLLTMRFWTGPGRVWLDRIPPFSLMRLQAGAGFLLAVVEYGRTGQAISTSLLERMAAAAPRYAASRIIALARMFVPAGANLGTAALMARQGFPAQDLNVVLRVLWNEEDGINRAGDFVERWLGRIEDSVKARMALLNGALLCLIAAALVALISVGLPIFEQLQKGIDF